MAKKKPEQVKLIDPVDLKDKPRNPLSGSKNEDFTYILCNQVAQTLRLADPSDAKYRSRQIHSAMNAVMGAKPKDELEGMLAAQMVAIHNAAMECFKRAMLEGQTFDARHMNLNHATKLTRSYATSMEALSRYRGKGQQKMTVEHVHVHAGGQAIVGNVTRQEGGVNEKTEGQAHAKQVTYAPGQSMPCQDTQREAMPVTSHA